MNDSILVQKIQVLLGERGTEGSAALVAQLHALVAQVPAQPSINESVAAPTKAEFDLLCKDVSAMFAAFNALRVLLP
jgi:hypothetical protein